jgi:hypothetical protein
LVSTLSALLAMMNGEQKRMRKTVKGIPRHPVRSGRYAAVPPQDPQFSVYVDNAREGLEFAGVSS